MKFGSPCITLIPILQFLFYLSSCRQRLHSYFPLASFRLPITAWHIYLIYLRKYVIYISISCPVCAPLAATRIVQSSWSEIALPVNGWSPRSTKSAKRLRWVSLRHLSKESNELLAQRVNLAEMMRLRKLTRAGLHLSDSGKRTHEQRLECRVTEAFRIDERPTKKPDDCRYSSCPRLPFSASVWPIDQLNIR